MNNKGTEGLNFRQLIGLVPRLPALHLAEPDAVFLSKLLTEEIIADRLAVMRCLAKMKQASRLLPR